MSTDCSSFIGVDRFEEMLNVLHQRRINLSGFGNASAGKEMPSLSSG